MFNQFRSHEGGAIVTADQNRIARSTAALVALSCVSGSLPAQGVPYRVAETPWDSESLGNHRVVLEVTQTARAVHVTVLWRRRDREPNLKAVILVDGKTGKPVVNVRRGTLTPWIGELDFEPISGPGRYYLYYLPYQSGGRSNYPNVKYLAATQTADSAWLARLASVPAVPATTVVAFEAIDSLNSFFPMEVPATPEESRKLADTHPGAAMMLFPEDRLHPIKMKEALPLRWVEREAGPADGWTDQARRGEFLAFQLGLYAIRQLDHVSVRFGELRTRSGSVIKASRITSFNTEGIDWDGRAFLHRVDVAAGTVQALWCGIDVPLSAKPGEYIGWAEVTAAGVAPLRVPLHLTVLTGSVLNAGANEPQKQTRLKWLNSTLGQRNTVLAPYHALQVAGHSIRLLGRRVDLAPSGLPRSIETFFTPEMTGYTTTAQPVLARPMSFEVGSSGETFARPHESGVRFTTREPGTVRWEAQTVGNGWTLVVRGQLEFDGYLTYDIRLKADRNLSVDDVRLVMPFAKAASSYMMGLGLTGQRRPDRLAWAWDVAKKNQDGAWIGGVNAGLWFSLRAENYTRPLNTNFYLQKPLNLPPSWGNGGRGGISIEVDSGAAVVAATSGPRAMTAGDSLFFNVNFLITPFHPIDPEYQWRHRFFHKYAPLDSIAATGATVVNIHHATPINPYINYPFIAHREMKDYIDEAHRRGLSVKIYNTVRELSNRAYELPALRSLAHEIFPTGKGGGYSWLQEHMGEDYIPAWFVPELKDAAILSSGLSRWHNYYVEGISWLVKNVGIDGLYLDDVAFDRTTMKRVKRVLLQNGRPGILDLHSANQYNERDGFINSAVLYLEHFPYLNRLWFGEYFDYQKNSPDFFLTEVSGIPFGLMGEMLEGGGNPWRGLLYGMTNRMPWSENADPRPIWKLWDDFGIKGSRMLGYWAPTVPVKTDNPAVLATVYVRPGRVLIALASWAPDTVTVKLHIDWKSLGLDSTRATLEAPVVSGLQIARTFPAGDGVPVVPGKGWFLVLRKERKGM